MERFWSKVDKTDGCWPWTGTRDRKGYGRFTLSRGKTVRCPRFAYERVVGKVPDGLLVCHHCDNPSCVRPDHLFLGTSLDNVRDAVAKGRHARVNVTHCPKGHEFTPENTVRRPDGARWCRECKRARGRAYRAGRRARAAQATT